MAGGCGDRTENFYPRISIDNPHWVANTLGVATCRAARRRQSPYWRVRGDRHQFVQRGRDRTGRDDCAGISLPGLPWESAGVRSLRQRRADPKHGGRRRGRGRPPARRKRADMAGLVSAWSRCPAAGRASAPANPHAAPSGSPCEPYRTLLQPPPGVNERPPGGRHRERRESHEVGADELECAATTPQPGSGSTPTTRVPPLL